MSNAIRTSAADFGLSRPEGLEVVDRIVSTIEDSWRDAADAARLSEADRSMLWKRSILNGSVFYE